MSDMAEANLSHDGEFGKHSAAGVARVVLYFTSPSFWLPGLSPGCATSWALSGLYDRVWRPAEIVAMESGTAQDDAFKALLAERCILFCDRTRLEACWDALDPKPDEPPSPYQQYPPDGYWIGLTCDWARRSGTLSSFPQLRVYSYWPQSLASTDIAAAYAADRWALRPRPRRRHPWERVCGTDFDRSSCAAALHGENGELVTNSSWRRPAGPAEAATVRVRPESY
jgi:hypothetical protein